MSSPPTLDKKWYLYSNPVSAQIIEEEDAYYYLYYLQPILRDPP